MAPDPHDLLAPFPRDLLTMWLKRVNSPDNDDKQLLDEISLPAHTVA